MTTFLQASWDDLAKKFDIFCAKASENALVKKAMTVLTHLILAVVALVLTVLIVGYVIYTISFIVPPYFQFMYTHGPYSFLTLLLLWFAALTRFWSLPSESQFSFRWEISMYALSFFVMFTGVGAFIVMPFLYQKN